MCVWVWVCVGVFVRERGKECIFVCVRVCVCICLRACVCVRGWVCGVLKHAPIKIKTNPWMGEEEIVRER